jgi:hypothetical protein
VGIELFGVDLLEGAIERGAREAIRALLAGRRRIGVGASHAGALNDLAGVGSVIDLSPIATLAPRHEEVSNDRHP